MTSAESYVPPYHCCVGTRRDGLRCSRLVSRDGDFCAIHAHQRVTLTCGCDGCADFAAIMSGPSRLHGTKNGFTGTGKGAA
jgi:hypothetical protein